MGSVKEVIGMDLGDKRSHVHVLESAGGELLEERTISTCLRGVRRFFSKRQPCLVAMEVGAHSPWVSRELEVMGHEVIVANPRQLKLISRSCRKSDRNDAMLLARLARTDVELLRPVRHRGEGVQAHLAMLRSRDGLVRARTDLINMVRGLTKSLGHRIPKCDTACFHRRASETLPTELRPAVARALAVIEELTRQIRAADKDLEHLCAKEYPETAALRQVSGVGPATSLAFVLTIDDRDRFESNRDVAAYLGLVPARSQSGASDPERRITKAGDPLLRRLLVQAAQYIMGPFGADSDLRKLGERVASKGERIAKRRAVIAVARKLAVLLLALWKTGEVYEPLRGVASVD